MDAPPVQYVTTSDGVKIAFAVTGSGPPIVVLGPAMGGMTHMWRFFPEWIEGLAGQFQVIQHDMHGHGMSQRGLQTGPGVDDQKAVSAILDHLKLDRVILLGLSGVGHVAIRFAANHSERVEALILCGTNLSLTVPSLYREVAA